MLAENVRGLLSSESNRFFGRVLRDMADMGYSVGWCCYGANAVGAPHQRERVFIVARMVNADSAGLPGGRRGTEAEQDCNRQDYGLPVAAGQDVADAAQQLSHGGGDTGQTGRGEFTDGSNLAHAKSDGLQREWASRKSVTPARCSETEPERQCDGEWQHGSTQSCLGRVPPRFSAGMDFPGWPAGWWPTPQARDWKGMQGQSYLGKAVDLPCAVRWPSGPGSQQHEWEPPRIAKGVPHRTQRLKALGNAVVPAQVYPILQAIAEIEVAGR